MRYFFATLAFIASATVALAADRWVNFEDPNDGLFTIEFQGAPRSETSFDATSRGSLIPKHTYTAERTDMAMVLWDTALPMAVAQVFTPDQINDMTEKGLVAEAASMGGTVQSDGPDMLDGVSGRRFSILRGDGIRTTYRVFFYDGHGYVALAAVPAASTPAQTSDVLHFLLSLHFMRP